MAGTGFTPEQVQRYARHLILPEVGGAGQRKLLDSSVLLMGAGGLGSPAGLYLAAAGVGRIAAVGADAVDAVGLTDVLAQQSDGGLCDGECIGGIDAELRKR